MINPAAPAERRRRDEGGIAVFTAVCILALLGIIGLVLDGGGKLRATERADALALEAARAAGQAIDPGAAVSGTAIRVDPAAAQAAAQAYLHSCGVNGSVAFSDDRTTVNVTIRETYATRFLSAVGVGSLPVTGHGSATLLRGVNQPE